MLQNGQVQEALESLLSLEKQTRLVSEVHPCTVPGKVYELVCYTYAYPSQASDAQSTGKVLTAIVQMCFDLQEWELLNEHILLLTKKRGQLKTVASALCISLSSHPLPTH